MKFLITAHIEVGGSFEVEAANTEEAIEKAQESLDEDGSDAITNVVHREPRVLTISRVAKQEAAS